MRGLTRLERRALTVDPNAVGECIPDSVFRELVRLGRGRSVDGYFEATPLGELALRVCPAPEADT